MKNMKLKKIIIFCFAMLFISTCFVSAYQNEDLKPIYKNKEKPTFNKATKIIKHTYGIGKFSTNHYRVMDKPIPIKESGNIDNQIIIDPVETPAEFCWFSKDGKDWTTYAKNQGNCGSCWLFSAMGAFEGVINIKEECSDLNPDLSEQYVLSCLPLAGSCNGGNVDNCVFYFIMNTSEIGYYTNGVITEDSFSYQSNFSYIPPCSDKPPNWEDFLVPISDYWECWPNLQDPSLKDTIKSLIYQKGPIMAYFWVSQRFIRWGTIIKNPEKYYPDSNEDCPYFVNHGITIVGWKDDPLIENGGYWICKNTWGPNWGYNGFFNIEYDCLNLGGFIAWVDYDPDSYDWPPVPYPGGFYQGEIGEEIIFDGSRSIDPEDEIVSYVWDFGDGTTSNGSSVSHSYDEQGIYPITLEVMDSIGQKTSHTTLVGVGTDPLSIDVTGGRELKISFTNPVDVDLKDFNYNIDMNGLIIPNKVSGIFESIPAGNQVEIDMNIFGIGFGKAQININEYIKSVNFFILGRLVMILNR